MAKTATIIDSIIIRLTKLDSSLIILKDVIRTVNANDAKYNIISISHLKFPLF